MTKLFRLLLSMIVIALATAASPTPSANAATLTAVAPVAEGRVLDPIAKPRGTLALSHFYPVPGPLRLGDVSGNANLFIPLAQAAVVKDAVIDIHYTNSIALQVNRSVLEIRLNDTTLAQLRLDPAQPVGQATVRLPVELWRPGYNKLTIAVSQHYTDACEDSESPELWTEVDLFHSHLTYEVAPDRAGTLLSDLDGLFAPGLGGFGEVLLLTAPDAQADRLRSEALPFIAQALALRRQFEPLIVDHATWRESGEPQLEAKYLPDSVGIPGALALIGTPDQLARILPLSELPVVDGPKITIHRDQGRVRLIVTGRTNDEVVAAARALTVINDPLTADRQVSISDDKGPTWNAPLVGRQVMEGGKTYSFDALGTPNTTATGLGANLIRVSLPLPSDFYTEESAMADVSLDFGYGAGMGPGSIMNIMLNGEYVHGVGFDNPAGTAYHGYQIHLPVRLMVPGVNTLDFKINSRPTLAGGQCLNLKGRHLLVQLLGSSTISLPAGGHVATLPDLARFANSGFPYVSLNDNIAGKMIVASPDLIGSALTLVGKLAQVAHAPMDGWRIDVGVPERIDQRAIVLATPQALTSEQFGDWSAAVGRTKKWPYRALNDLRAISDKPHLTLATLVEALLGKTSDDGSRLGTPSMTQRSDLGGLGILMAFRNPQAKADQSLMVITADSPTIIAERVDDLIQPELWGQMKGDLMAWQGLTSPFTIQVADHYEVGSQDPWLLLRLTMSANPWYWLAGVSGVTGIAALLCVLLLRRRGRHLDEGGR